MNASTVAADMWIEPYEPSHLEAIVRLSLRAWAPVFESLESAMESDVFRELYPDWRLSQENAVRDVCAATDMEVGVACSRAAVMGFVAFRCDAESKMGEVYMIAVDPDYQRQGIATALTAFATERMKSSGMSVAMVETGGDAGHAPARHTYEKAGFAPLPIERYFKKL